MNIAIEGGIVIKHQHQSQPQPQPQPKPDRQRLGGGHFQRSSSKRQHVPTCGLTFWLLVVCLLSPVLPEVIYRVDPLALLAATLRTYQRAGCDSEQLALSCPRGTSISIELAQYGRAGDLSDHSLCPPVSTEDLTTTGSTSDSGVIHSGTEIEVKPPEACTVSGLQYALLQTVVDACQKKRHCKFAANPKTLASRDPCSGIRKFVEIAYKCRPYEFRSKVACENDNMPLVCNPYSRIAIYSAAFGHIERESVQCGHGNTPTSSEDSNKQTCLVSYATETVMQICHGRRRCSVTADAGTFGRPCKSDVRMYLKVVYTCIPRKVLKDRYETAPESDEPQQSELDMDQDELYDEDQFYKESEAIPPAPKLQGAIPNSAFPYDFNLGAESVTSTLMPPLLSRNDSSLEDRLQSSAHDQVDSGEYFYSSSATSTVSKTTIATDINATDSNNIDMESDESTWQNFFYKRRCEMQDDWGPIGLNCTDEDIIIERVKVIGFLVNWAQAYVHIRKNQEQFYLYLIISVAAGVLLCLTLVIGRLTLQRRRGSRKNSSSSSSNNEKNCSDGGGGGKYHGATGETHLPHSFGDNISDIDADIDLTSPMPVPSLSSRNETYMTYAPAPNCSYGSLAAPNTSGSYATATTMMMPHHGGMPLPGHGSQAAGKPMSGPTVIGGSRQPTPPPATLYTSMGVCSPSVSGTMTMGPHMLTPAALSSVSQHSTGAPSYLSGSIMVPGHHHAHIGTLRRTLVPTSMGMMTAPAPTPAGTAAPHAMTGIPSASSIYYDSTIPRNLSRGMSADSTQYFYG